MNASLRNHPIRVISQFLTVCSINDGWRIFGVPGQERGGMSTKCRYVVLRAMRESARDPLGSVRENGPVRASEGVRDLARDPEVSEVASAMSITFVRPAHKAATTAVGFPAADSS